MKLKCYLFSFFEIHVFWRISSCPDIFGFDVASYRIKVVWPHVGRSGQVRSLDAGMVPELTRICKG